MYRMLTCHEVQIFVSLKGIFGTHASAESGFCLYHWKTDVIGVAVVEETAEPQV